MPPSHRVSLASTQTTPVPSDALLLNFSRSDGEPSNWPTPNPGPARDSDGKLNYYRPVDLNERGSVDWRKKIGSTVAGLLKLPSK